MRRRNASPSSHVEREGEPAAAQVPASEEIENLVLVNGQQRLPLPWHLVRPFEESSFAHPAELDLARILSFYRIRWVYEPTTFHLMVADDGRPIEQVTPDFYLPDHHLYIELTTMRQRLVTKKNRKIRRLREVYPTVQIKLLYRKDYHRLIESYPSPVRNASIEKVGNILFTEEQLATRISELAREIVCGCSSGTIIRACKEPVHAICRSLFGEEPPRVEPITQADDEDWESTAMPLQLLGFGPGSRTFLAALRREIESLGEEPLVDRISLTRYRTPHGGRRVRVRRAPRFPIQGREIVLVTDIVSTGLSLAYLTDWLRRRGARRVRICTLLDRRDARLIEVPLEFVGFDAPNELLIGFGLALRRQFRDLPYIAALAYETNRATEAGN